MSMSALIARQLRKPAHAVFTKRGYVARDGYSSHAELASLYSLEDANCLSQAERGVVKDLLAERGILERMSRLYE